MRIVNQDKVYNNERDLVPILAYGEDQAYIPDKGSLDLGQGPMLSFQEGQYNMDLNTLLFIARQGRGAMPQASKKL